jgi:hypothetical protein
MPRLLLITASSDEIRRARRSRFLNFQQITMPYLAARVPSDWQVTHVDEEAEDIDWTDQPDVVGITFHTPSAYHAYDLAAVQVARSVRRNGRPACDVAAGGGRPTCRRDLCGRSRRLWEEFLNGFKRGPIVACTGRPARVSGGCPHGAQSRSFTGTTSRAASYLPPGDARTAAISVPCVMYEHGLRKRPIAEVAAEYGSFHGKRIIFWDDNIAAPIRNMQNSCFVPSRLIASGGAARPPSMRPRMTSFWTRQPGVGASSCFWAWSRSPSRA